MVDKYIENESPFWQTNSGLSPKKPLKCFGFFPKKKFQLLWIFPIHKIVMTKFQNNKRERERERERESKQAAHSKVVFGDGSDKNLLLWWGCALLDLLDMILWRSEQHKTNGRYWREKLMIPIVIWPCQKPWLKGGRKGGR